MSVRRSAWIGAVVGVALVLFFGIFLVRQSVALTRAIDDVATVYDPAAAQSALLDTAISDMQRGVTGYLLTAAEQDLAPYVAGTRRSDLALQQLEQVVAEDEQLQEVVQWVQQDRTAWIEQVARPTIDEVRAGNSSDALAIFEAPGGQRLFLTLQADAATLKALIDDRRRDAFNDLAGLSYRLFWAVVLTTALLGGSLVLAYALANRRILAPLDQLSGQIRLVARRGEHTRTIGPTGPAELHSLGADVELLRRQLVWEIDEARSAREALEQKAPVVAAIRAELAAGSAVSVPGLAIHGELHPAEGVLAGDWWASALLHTGEAAVVVADISGHGPEAGIAAMRLKYAIRHDLVAELDIDAMAVNGAAVFANTADRFATVAAVCVDPESGRIRYLNAGHHPPLIVDASGRVVARLERTGPILSWLGGHWGIGTAQLAPGDTVLLYSDGLIESHDIDGNELGEEHVEAWLAEAAPGRRDPRDLVAWLLGAARERAVDWSRDDVTIVAIRRSAPPTAG